MSRDDFLVAFAQWFAEHDQSHSAFLAEHGDEPVGMAWLTTVERVPGPGVWRRVAGNLQSVYVLPDARGRGTGAALVRAALDEAVARGFDYVSVHPSERSFSLYRRVGFTDTDGVLEADFRSR